MRHLVVCTECRGGARLHALAPPSGGKGAAPSRCTLSSQRGSVRHGFCCRVQLWVAADVTRRPQVMSPAELAANAARAMPVRGGQVATLDLQAWHARCHHKSGRSRLRDRTLVSRPDGSSLVGVTARVRCNGGRVLMDSRVYACMLVCAVRATAREPCRRTSR